MTVKKSSSHAITSQLHQLQSLIYLSKTSFHSHKQARIKSQTIRRIRRKRTTIGIRCWTRWSTNHWWSSRIAKTAWSRRTKMPQSEEAVQWRSLREQWTSDRLWVMCSWCLTKILVWVQKRRARMNQTNRSSRFSISTNRWSHRIKPLNNFLQIWSYSKNLWMNLRTSF